MNRPFYFLTVVSLAALVWVCPAHADLLVYEGFTGYTSGKLEGQTPNANTTGLNTSVGYYDDGVSTTRTVNYTLLSTGLTFGSLATNGGALQFTAGTNVIGADISIGATPFTGTLWSSYLVKFTATPGGLSSDGSTIRIGDKPSDSPGGHFNSWADSRPAVTASTMVSVGYSSASPNAANGTASLALNTTYIIINSFTRVGQTLGTGSSQGVAKLWALTENQFVAFREAGGDETTLNALAGSSVTATATSSLTSGTLSFSSTDSFGIVTVNNTGVYDELRFGSTLADVTPIPEPATMAMITGLSAMLAFAARRRRA
jgi:hypothetical protein